MPPVVLLVGDIGSGKSTAAKLLSKYGFTEDYFAKPLKDFALSLGFKHKQIYGKQSQKEQVNKFWLVSGRNFMQTFGTEVCRDFLPKALPKLKLKGRKIWARVMEGKIKRASKPLVISDGRFADEVKLVKDYGGVVIRIIRQLKPMTRAESKKHMSEQNFNNLDCDYFIENDSTIEDLEFKLRWVLRQKFPGLVDESVNEPEACESEGEPDLTDQLDDEYKNTGHVRIAVAFVLFWLLSLYVIHLLAPFELRGWCI